MALTLLCLLMVSAGGIISGNMSSWPGPPSVAVVDDAGYFGENLSGLFYEQYQANNKSSSDVIWAVQNSPSMLYKLYWTGKVWTSSHDGGWSKGKKIHFSNGKGHPDSEDLTKAALGDDGDAYSDEIYVCTERDNDYKDVSFLTVLLYKMDDNSDELTASFQWDLTSKLPKVNCNKGFEGIAWVSDSFLVSSGFIDMNTKSKYDPSRYSNHGTGLFFLALEGNGMIYGFALNNHTADSIMITSFASEEAAISGLYFDHYVGQLWTQTDDCCKGVQHVFRLVDGSFQSIGRYDRPTGMGDFNTEGFTTTPETQCGADGTKPAFWADDSNDNNHAIREGRVDCGLLL